VIEARDLVKSYGDHLALDRVSFSAGPGVVLGLLGPNGAGKSTAMKILAGFLVPTDGTAVVAGLDVQDHSREVRRRLGYLPENASLYSEMRVREYLSYRAALKQVPRANRATHVERALGTCGLLEVRERIIGQLSRGFRQRVSLAAVLVHDPTVLILDEPTVGLDPLQIREIRQLVRSLGRERTVLFSTHILPEAEAVCDRVVILDHGKVLADATPRELAASLQPRELALEFVGDVQLGLKALREVPGVAVEVLQETPTVRVGLRADAPASTEVRSRISRALTGSGAVIVELSCAGATLEEVFAKLTGKGDAA
jgi:ABC-2 type transport system ATP-binding protein